MTKNKIFAALLVIFSLSSVFVNAQTDPNNWDKLNLNSTTIAGTKVYYEKSFESKLPFFEKIYKEVLEEQGKSKIMDSKKDEILADINNILGIKETQITEMQAKGWASFLSQLPRFENPTFYLVKQDTIKDFLRAGGKLPNFTYAKESDTVGYNPTFESSSKNPQSTLSEFAFPIDSVENFEKTVDTIFKIFNKDLGRIMEGTVIHEITEMTLMTYIKQTDPYIRWFSDGFSEAITYELLKKHFDIARADEYISTRNLEQFSEYKKINLRYWMSGQFCILTAGLPTKQGSDYTLARYAYATYEARRLVDKYGIGCVSKILDDITKKDSRTGNDLIESIKNVTGEDMNVRLDEYQSFENKQEAIEKYANAFNKAAADKNHEQMLFNLFRMHDFRQLSDIVPILDDFRYASTLLFKSGYEKEADSALNNCMELFSNSSNPNGKLAVYEVIIYYALETNQPTKAFKAADELLKEKPDHVGALTIKMYEHLGYKRFDQAKEIAQQIVDDSVSENTRNYKVAVQVLALDPNQLPTQ